MNRLLKRSIETIGALAISTMPIVGCTATAEATTTVAAPADAVAGHSIPIHLDHHDWIDHEGGFGQWAEAPRVDTSVRGGPGASVRVRSEMTR